jgi:hypothetical protein
VEAIGISRFPSIGMSYNRLHTQSGKAYEGQPIGRRGAHTVNDFRRSTCSTSGCPGRGSSLSAPSWNLNYNARAYVICQNTQHSVTDAQLDALARAIAADKLAGFVTRSAQLHGHRCVSSKSCPGDKMWSRMGELEKKVNNYLANGLDEQKEWWEMAIPDSELDKIAERVWDRKNVDGTTMGTLAKWTWEAFTKKITDPITGKEETPRTLLKWARQRSYNGWKISVANLKAIQPLLLAAEEGRSLSAADVASIAEAVKEANVSITAAEVADELEVGVKEG